MREASLQHKEREELRYNNLEATGEFGEERKSKAGMMEDLLGE